MLKKSLFSPAQPRRAETRLFPCVVLGSSKSSTYQLSFSEVGSAGGVFPFAKIHCTGERPHGVRSVPPPVSTRLRPCLGQGASRRAGVGRVRSLDFLSILFGILLLLSISADQVAG